MEMAQGKLPSGEVEIQQLTQKDFEADPAAGRLLRISCLPLW